MSQYLARVRYWAMSRADTPTTRASGCAGAALSRRDASQYLARVRYRDAAVSVGERGVAQRRRRVQPVALAEPLERGLERLLVGDRGGDPAVAPDVGRDAE